MLEEVVHESPTEGRRGLYDGFDSVLDAAKAYAMEPELIIDGPIPMLWVSELLSDLIDIIENSSPTDPRGEEVVYESPTEGWRVEYEQVDLNFDHSIRSAYWVSEGFYAHRKDAESEARNLERRGNRVRIVKVVA